MLAALGITFISHVPQARLDEMQAQYDRLLSEIDETKRQAKQVLPHPRLAAV